jgi:hypothetical protein
MPFDATRLPDVLPATTIRLRRSRRIRSSAGRMARSSSGVQVARPWRTVRRRLTNIAPLSRV